MTKGARVVSRQAAWLRGHRGRRGAVSFLALMLLVAACSDGGKGSTQVGMTSGETPPASEWDVVAGTKTSATTSQPDNGSSATVKPTGTTAPGASSSTTLTTKPPPTSTTAAPSTTTTTTEPPPPSAIEIALGVNPCHPGQTLVNSGRTDRGVLFFGDSGGGGADTLMVAPGDGSAPAEQIPPDGAAFHNSGLGPLWSPNGNFLAFSDIYSSLWIGRPDGTKVTAVAPGRVGYVGAWAPDGRRLAVALVEDDHWDLGVYIVDLNGTIVRRVTDKGHASHLSWSPDGTVVTWSYPPQGMSGGAWELWAANANAGAPVFLGNLQGASWSPDGCEYTSVSHPDGIVVRRWDSTENRVVAPGVGAYWTPQWSPTEHRILVPGGCGGVLILEGDDLHPHCIYKGTSFTARFSPEGTRIAFEARGYPHRVADDYDFEVLSIGVDGTGLVSLSPGFFAREPNW
jgi:hypothetical protein